jgi:HEAT repeat protein
MMKLPLSIAVVAALCVMSVRPSYGQKPQTATTEKGQTAATKKVSITITDKASTGLTDEAKLIAVLKSDAPRKAKADACRELARIGTRASVAPLAALLCDEQLSHMARYGLEPIPDPAVDSALRDALGKAKGRQLVGVIGSLGVRRDHHAVAALTKHLADSDAEVVQASARALGRIGTLDASKALESSLSKTAEVNRLAFYEGLFRCADVLRAQGQREAARAIYESLRSAPAPPQVQAGATRALEGNRPR